MKVKKDEEVANFFFKHLLRANYLLLLLLGLGRRRYHGTVICLYSTLSSKAKLFQTQVYQFNIIFPSLSFKQFLHMKWSYYTAFLFNLF